MPTFEAEERDIIVANRANHMAYGLELAKWRATVLLAIHGAAAVALIPQLKDRPALSLALIPLAIGIVLCVVAVEREIVGHSMMQGAYADRLKTNATGSTFKPAPNRPTLNAAEGELRQGMRRQRWSIAMFVVALAVVAIVQYAQARGDCPALSYIAPALGNDSYVSPSPK